MQVFTLSTIPHSTWKNGGGSTQEIACSPAGASMDAFDWRVSVAHIERDGPFSVFENIDRTLILLSGEGMFLNDVLLGEAGALYQFSGETPIVSRLRNGATTDFNVMTRRGKVRAAVNVQRDSFVSESGTATRMVYVVAGQWKVNAAQLTDQQGIIASEVSLNAVKTSVKGLAITVSFTPW